MQRRRQFTQVQNLEERLAEEAKRLREQAEALPHGAIRDAALRTGASGRDRFAYE